METSRFPETISPVLTLKLPWPPSVNNYYGRTRTGRVFIKKAGQEFRATVVDALADFSRNNEPLSERLQVWVEAYPPDRRRRDLDNLKKALFDALTHAEIYEDDCLIDDDRCVRCEPVKGGFVRVHIGIYEKE